MQNIPLYIKIEEKIVVTNPKVYVKDIAKVYCKDSYVLKGIQNIVIQTIKEQDTTKIVFSIMYVIDKILKEYPQVQVINLGEKDFIIEYLVKDKKNQMCALIKNIKIILISLIVFFGAGFTIMTFNSDVDVAHLFDKIDKLVLGTEDGKNVIEIAYSVGIGLGIVLFFNHFSRNKANEIPSPLHVEMRNYEQELNHTLIEDASREKKIKDI